MCAVVDGPQTSQETRFRRPTNSIRNGNSESHYPASLFASFDLPFPSANGAFVNSPTTPARILVVDDESMARESLCALLAKEDHLVWETGEGDKVESIVREQRPEVVLLDLRLPGKDGLSILKSLDQAPLPPSVIVMTAYGTS